METKQPKPQPEMMPDCNDAAALELLKASIVEMRKACDHVGEAIEKLYPDNETQDKLFNAFCDKLDPALDNLEQLIGKATMRSVGMYGR